MVTRSRTRAQRRAILNEAGNDEDLEGNPGIEIEGDEVFLSPIKAASSESDLTEARRKINASSQPSSPLLSARVPHPQPDIIDEDAPTLPQPEIKSNDALIDLAGKIAEGKFLIQNDINL